ncbi:hypothetical protein G9A89_009770 [Geosiphon pyriformis]|nr:hypothetical protein G9A89_009770 [Geosiphon pyriformis]
MNLIAYSSAPSTSFAFSLHLALPDRKLVSYSLINLKIPNILFSNLNKPKRFKKTMSSINSENENIFDIHVTYPPGQFSHPPELGDLQPGETVTKIEIIQTPIEETRSRMYEVFNDMDETDEQKNDLEGTATLLKTTDRSIEKGTNSKKGWANMKISLILIIFIVFILAIIFGFYKLSFKIFG